MLSMIPAFEQSFAAFVGQVLEGGALEERDIALAVLTFAFASEDSEAVKRAIVAAKQTGVTNEEIGHISAVVIALRGQKVAALGQVTPPAGSAMGESNCCR
jgi:alkylhydroperoxidase/carboxymuconolactone decarboxylase family protein YurZ